MMWVLSKRLPSKIPHKCGFYDMHGFKGGGQRGNFKNIYKMVGKENNVDTSTTL